MHSVRVIGAVSAAIAFEFSFDSISWESLGHSLYHGTFRTSCRAMYLPPNHDQNVQLCHMFYIENEDVYASRVFYWHSFSILIKSRLEYEECELCSVHEMKHWSSICDVIECVLSLITLFMADCHDKAMVKSFSSTYIMWFLHVYIMYELYQRAVGIDLCTYKHGFAKD
jgi:hypothetical protein